jgi:ABC-type bacteriocin/lantibiotic exporter with double-glycine peptidase domain
MLLVCKVNTCLFHTTYYITNRWYTSTQKEVLKQREKPLYPKSKDVGFYGLYYKQTTAGGCLPTSIAMVFSKYRKSNKDQVRVWMDELSAALGTDENDGTPLESLIGFSLEPWGFRHEVKESDLETVKRNLQHGIPLICIIESQYLPYSTEERLHAVVLVGIDEQSVFLNDPLREGDEVIQFPLQTFHQAWGGWGNQMSIRVEPL